MPGDDRIERLELEIKQLREMLETGGARRQVADLSPEDLQAYSRVRDVIVGNFGEFCGINDCFRCVTTCRICRVCEVCAVCRVCIFECSCGPCNIGGQLGTSGLSRFRDLGE